jgi:ribosomal protein S18 acetylase RimI-like enzyme
MASLTKLLASSSEQGKLRPIDVRHDLNQIADLMEHCFADTLDPDGQRYLQQMRAAANNPSYLRWTTMMSEGGTVPVTGYVWEEAGQIVGNLTLIPYYSLGRRYFLVANVAVQPEYRRKGIATSLTMKAIEHARQRGAQAVWLHVRADNEGAFHMYRTLGFIERARRTTWIYDTISQRDVIVPGTRVEAPSYPGISIQGRRSGDWRQQRAWLEKIYPAELSWHLSLKYKALSPGLWGFLKRFLNDIQVRQWSAWRRNQLLGVLAWQSMLGYADSLWLATTPEYEESVVGMLLHHARTHLSSRRPLSLDFPAGRAGPEIQVAGFRIHQTLIWMSMNL